MKYFNFKSLIILLLLHGVSVYLDEIWTSDKGWIALKILFAVFFLIIFWVIISFISYLKKSHLKMEYCYYIGLGILSIIVTIFHYKVARINDLGLAHFGILLLICILPIKQIWIRAE